MRKINASSILIVLGFSLCAIVIISSLVYAQRNSSPFDQLTTADPSSVVINPNIGLKAPTLPSESQVVTAVSPLITATAMPTLIPDRIVIPAIKLDAPVVMASVRNVEYLDKAYQQWVAPASFAAGMLSTSAPLGVVGNTVLIGHQNIYGDVFGHLQDLKIGDLIFVYSVNNEFAYKIAYTTIVPERWQSVEVRIQNTQWISPSEDERLTLSTCWPYNSNTHRLFVVAFPVKLETALKESITPRSTQQPTMAPTFIHALP